MFRIITVVFGPVSSWQPTSKPSSPAKLEKLERTVPVPVAVDSEPKLEVAGVFLPVPLAFLVRPLRCPSPVLNEPDRGMSGQHMGQLYTRTRFSGFANLSCPLGRRTTQRPLSASQRSSTAACPLSSVAFFRQSKTTVAPGWKPACPGAQGSMDADQSAGVHQPCCPANCCCCSIAFSHARRAFSYARHSFSTARLACSLKIFRGYSERAPAQSIGSCTFAGSSEMRPSPGGAPPRTSVSSIPPPSPSVCRRCGEPNDIGSGRAYRAPALKPEWGAVKRMQLGLGQAA
mmetsp:Transcript_88762/g.287414  ORF Transcript_88762/g.287414 Transcript_88762/m.287414 type:complete len:288 (+) Transcript_88762:590-1453(+)